MKKMLRFILLLVVVLGIAAGIGMWKVRQLADSKLLIKEETIFTLEAGTGAWRWATAVCDKVINRPRVFQWLLRIKPELSHFKAGTYRFTPDMTVREMLQLLASGKEAQFPLRFVEGMRVSDYLRQLRDAPYVKHTLADDSYETVAKALELEHPDGSKAGSGRIPGCIPPIPAMWRSSSARIRRWSPRSIKPGKGGWRICRIKIRTSC
jgi:UPF0755 protein